MDHDNDIDTLAASFPIIHPSFDPVVGQLIAYLSGTSYASHGSDLHKRLPVIIQKLV